MKSGTKNCQNCKQDFTIEPEDFNFYEKIKVPPPTWCPPCRSIRRMIHRNERNLFRRTCDVTGKNIISIYRPDSPYLVCDKDVYFSDNFDPMRYGKAYDTTRKFFDQFYEFAKQVPMPSLYIKSSNKADYNQDMSSSYNCYLCSRTHDSKNIFYGYRVNKSADCVDCFQAVAQSEFLYECVNVVTSNNSQFLHTCEKCSDSAFLYNCVCCVDCFMCTDLRNKQCCYKNKQYSRDEYKKILESYNLGTYNGQQKALKEFEEFIKQFPRENLNIVRSNNVSGDGILDSRNCNYVFNVRGCENASYIWDSFNYKDSMDAYSGAGVELVYEATATTSGSSNCHFCVRVAEGSRDCEYSWFLINCANCFGCIGLKNKQCCIFNVQYTKEEYQKLVSELVVKMTEDHEYGEFFPLYFSPFPYNDTVAHEYFPLNESEAKSLGLAWGDFEEKKYQTTIKASDLEDDIAKVNDSILEEIIACEDEGQCEHGCTKAFKIITDELLFYRRKGVPLPRKCPNCRYYRRLAYRNPTKLWNRKCQCAGQSSDNHNYANTGKHSHGVEHCPNEFETSYAPERPEIVYCEKCYQQEVY